MRSAIITAVIAWTLLPIVGTFAANDGANETQDQNANNPPALTLTFIGNEAFLISDGEKTLATDFPYQSGYSRYMTYDPGYLDFTGDIVSLITHRHLDHFDPGLFRSTGWRVIGPKEVTVALNPLTVVPLEDTVEYKGLKVTPIRTEHSKTEHYSYLVEWRGKSLFLIGDIETADVLFELDQEVDIAFLTPWALRPLLAEKRGIPARQIIVYHHTAIEDTPVCDKCLTPFRGQVIRVEYGRQ